MSSEAPKYPGLNLGAVHGGDHEAAESLMFGFWVFLMSDVILFGLVFATYATLVHATAGGPGPRELYDLRSAFVQTLLLLASSYTMGRVSLALKHRAALARLAGWLVLTLLLGLVFLGFALHDLSAMVDKGGVPSRSAFLSAFWGLVPLHALHVAAGCAWLICLLGQAARFGADRQTKLGVMRLALFWHFLDLVWIAIFSVVYLGGVV